MAREKLCLSCKYEPEWSEPAGVEYPRRKGQCKYPLGDIKMAIRKDVWKVIIHDTL